jgi:uncharacterized protein (TIGR03083 family)
VTDTNSVAIVDTDRDELRERIEDMRQRFYRLALAADPEARSPGSEWTVRQIVAHVLSVANRYRTYAETGDFRRAKDRLDLDRINREELAALTAPIPDLIDQLKAVAPLMDSFADNLTDDFTAEFHFGVMVSAAVVQINWLFELIFHGEDIARALLQPWEIRERDMLLIMREMVEVAPVYVRPEAARANDICAALQVPDARPYVIHVHDGVAEMRARRPADRVDVVFKAPASTMVRMLMGRIGPLTATRCGLRIVGGRRPWKAMKLQSCFDAV